MFADPEHPRAPGNMAHYEALLEKNKFRTRGDDGELEDFPAAEQEPNPIPERERYEDLCRGEKLIVSDSNM